MPVSVETVAPCRKKIRVEIPAEQVASTRAEIVAELRKRAQIPGFRPGKAPLAMVEKFYAKTIEEEVQQRLIPESYRQALEEQKLQPVGQPRVESVDYQPGQRLCYVAQLDTAPEFTLPEYKGIPLRKQERTVTDADVAAALDRLRQEHASYLDVTNRGLQMGDYAVLDYSGVVEGKPIAELVPAAKPLSENHDFWVLMSAEGFLPGFCAQLAGAVAGEKRQVLVDFPPDFPQQALAGKKATYFVEVKGIKEKKLPSADDEFAKRIGFESLAQLQAAIRAQLEALSRELTKEELRQQIAAYLLDRCEFELPDSLLEAERRSIVYDVVRQSTLRGVSKEQLERQKDEIFAHATQSATERLRLSFILDAIAEREQITVTAAEVEQRINELARRHNLSPQRLRAKLAEQDGLSEIEDQILVVKTLDFLEANAKLQEHKE